MPVKQIYVEDCEADDVIGYLCNYKLKNDIKLIISSDHDYYQLINERTRIWSPTLKALVDIEKVIDRFGIHPENFCLAKCVVGDPSDNIKGAKGVGYKTLVKHFSRFTDEQNYMLEAFLQDAGRFNHEKNLKSLQSILDNADTIKRNWKLIYLDTNSLSANQISKVNFSSLDKKWMRDVSQEVLVPHKWISDPIWNSQKRACAGLCFWVFQYT